MPKTTFEENNYRIYQNYDFENKNLQPIEALVISNPERLQLYRRASETSRTSRFGIQRFKSIVMNYEPKDEINMFSNFNRIIIDRDITCTEFAPDVFAHLRNLDGFKNENLKRSMDPQIDANIDRIFKAGEGMGKSGSFFFFSHDT